MANKPDSKLIETPVQEMCGSASNRGPATSATSTVYGLPGPEGVSAGLGADPVLVYTDINPDTTADRPADSKRFQGVSDAK